MVRCQKFQCRHSHNKQAIKCARHAEEKRTQEGVVTYPLQSEVSPTFRRFQGLVSCLVFSSKFTSSWGGKRKDPVNAQGTCNQEPRHRHSQKRGENQHGAFRLCTGTKCFPAPGCIMWCHARHGAHSAPAFPWA